ncbi:MAG: DUF3343 domain-containing protein [Ruminococcaceae bacterium]|nr:DUF3343 domain-containing protein [Oscillospiraceae bacterium]
MNTIIISLSSVTYAIKAKKLLERNNIKATLIKNSTQNSEKGCTYGIKTDRNYLYDAVAILKKKGIDYSVISDI